jgi:hypothetical protein
VLCAMECREDALWVCVWLVQYVCGVLSKRRCWQTWGRHHATLTLAAATLSKYALTMITGTCQPGGTVKVQGCWKDYHL